MPSIAPTVILVRNNFAKILNRRPQVLIAVAGVLTLAWLALLILASLRLLQLV